MNKHAIKHIYIFAVGLTALLGASACRPRQNSADLPISLAAITTPTQTSISTEAPTHLSVDSAVTSVSENATATSTLPLILPTHTPAVTPIAALIGSMNTPQAQQIILYSAPNTFTSPTAMYDTQQFALIEGRTDDGEWFYVYLPYTGLSGWVPRDTVFAQTDLGVLPAITPAPFSTLIVTVPTGTPTPISSPTPTPVILGDIPAMQARLNTLPTLYNMNTERVRSIFQIGQQLGNRADVFTVIGDSNSVNGDFLQPFGLEGDFCNYAPQYATLTETVQFFSSPVWMSTDPAVPADNSFTHDSLTADVGFNSAAVLDPFWAAPTCAPGEMPLSCEYRSSRPAVAIIMLGGIDINEMQTQDYYRNMVTIVEESVRAGTIPVLTTFVVLPNRDVYPRSLEFNMMLIDISDLYQIPLINLWREAQSLPDYGIGPDRTHLKAEPGRYCDFRGWERQFGGTLRNLLTLQTLDTLRREVMGR